MENSKEIIDLLNKLIDENAQVLVGQLLKRIEVLSDEQVLTPNLFKSLTREHIYEASRQLKKLVKIYLEIGKVTFTSKE